jgi:hypothetical protein
VAVPTDPIGAGRYLICLLHFGFDVDFGLINLALNENGYILPILVAVTILGSENCNKCGEETHTPGGKIHDCYCALEAVRPTPQETSTTQRSRSPLAPSMRRSTIQWHRQGWK